jgi:lauroyl/myristoyl acyltransferase
MQVHILWISFFCFCRVYTFLLWPWPLTARPMEDLTCSCMNYCHFSSNTQADQNLQHLCSQSPSSEHTSTGTKGFAGLVHYLIQLFCRLATWWWLVQGTWPY